MRAAEEGEFEERSGRRRVVPSCRGETDSFERAPVPDVGTPKTDRLLRRLSKSFSSRRRRRGGLEGSNGLLQEIQLVHGIGVRRGSKNFDKDLVHKPRRDRFALEAKFVGGGE